MKELYEFDAVLHEIPEKGGAYVIFPWNVREEFGKGRQKVQAFFDGIEYFGSLVNMGLKTDDGEVCYIIGVKKSIRQELGKSDRDMLNVKIIPILDK